ncbi:helix-turn-helix domain-containing protein [Nonlabens xiamenensis]|uniref:helix-turn-helix domain-containing protein n=1 Tax=Nonlabens xiamenensis TaxID=2341043 RepID=UPI000F60E076|nr:helix-turn-helix transcriptional regulator [Nonlabens xiamenensis]
MEQPELGIYIAQLRKQQGLTQEELVEMCNINVRTIQRIENGEVTPRSYTIKNILDALGTSIDEVFKPVQKNSKLQPLQVNQSLLGNGMVCGIFYLILSTLTTWIAIADQFDGSKLISYSWYIILSLVSFAALVFFYIGGVKYAQAFQARLFKHACYGFMILSLLLVFVDVLTYIEIVDTSSGLGLALATLLIFIYGLGYMFLGAGLFTYRNSLGDLAKWAGISALIGGFGYVFILLFPVGILFSFIFEVILMILLYRTWEQLKS